MRSPPSSRQVQRHGASRPRTDGRRRLRVAPLCACMALALCGWAPGATAATTVYRCESADGVRIYTDRPCSELDAVPRAAHDTLPLPSAPEGGTAASACPARTADELPAALERAFAARDVNALAGIYHWTGMDAREAARVLDRLEALVERPLLGVGLGSGAGGFAPMTGDVASAAPTGAEVWLSLGEQHAPGHLRLSVLSNAGCVWLRF